MDSVALVLAGVNPPVETVSDWIRFVRSLPTSPLLRFYIDACTNGLITTDSVLSREFAAVCAHHISKGPDFHQSILNVSSQVVACSFAARNPTFLLIPTLILISSDLIQFTHSALAYLTELQHAASGKPSRQPLRMVVARIEFDLVLKEATANGVTVVGVDSSQKIYVNGTYEKLRAFRKCLPVPSAGRIIDECIDFGTDNLPICYQQNSAVREIKVLHPSTGDLQILMRDDVNNNACEILQGLISSVAARPFDDSAVLQACRNRYQFVSQIELFSAGSAFRPATDKIDIPVHPPPPAPLSAAGSCPGRQVAIIGISCRVPGAESLDEFWKNLCDGLDCHQKVPARLYGVENYQSASYRDKNTMRASHMNVLDRPGLFDPALFSEPTEEATRLDPQQRLALLVAYEAFQMAAQGSNLDDSEEGGVFIGSCSDDYRENLSKPIKEGLYSQTFRSHIASRLSSYFNMNGPSLTYDTACSSALVTFEAACSYIVAGKCSTALAGGVNVLTQPQISIGLDRGFFLSSTGQCKTFDTGADGYCRSDAIGFLVLKSYEHAIRDNDNILGVISAAGTNHSGPSYSITHPHSGSQSQLYRAGLSSAKLRPDEIDYIECHGTGTQAGDAEEMEGILDVYANRGEHRDINRQHELIVASVKANLGHSESASGATALLKGLLALQKNKVPPHIGVKTKINPIFPKDLLELGIKIPFPEHGVPFVPTPISTRGRCMMINNFSAAGGNSSIVVHEAAEHNRSRLLSAQPSSKHQLFVYSAQTQNSLCDGLKQLRQFILSSQDLRLEDLCYTLATGRLHHDLRAAGLVQSFEDILALIDDTLKNPPYSITDRSSASLYHAAHCQEDVHKKEEWGWLFTGQGSQWKGMGKSLYESSPVFGQNMDAIRKYAIVFGFPDFLPFILDKGDDLVVSGPTCTQLATFALEYSFAQVLLSSGFARPSVVAGHSLGEYVSLVISGILTISDAVYLVGKRAQLLQSYCIEGVSCMLAVQLDQASLTEFLKSLDEDQQASLPGGERWANEVEVACRNSPESTVLAGRKELIENLQSLLKEKLATKSVKLDTPYAFHSAAVEPIVIPYSEILNNLCERSGCFSGRAAPYEGVKFLSNVIGKVVTSDNDKQFDKSYLVTHARNTVKFLDAFEDLQKTSTTVPQKWIEIGPHPTLSPMLNSCLQGAEVYPTFKRSTDATFSVLSLLKSLYQSGRQYQGRSMNFSRWSNSLGWNLAARTIHLPSYSFDQKEYWVDFSDRGLRPHLIQSKKGHKKTAKKPMVLPKQQPDPVKFPLLSQCLYFDEQLQKKERITILELDTRRCEIATRAILGHTIMDTGMAPGTFFSEVALQAGEFLRNFEEAENLSNVSVIVKVVDLDMISSLLMDETSRPTVRISVKGNLSSTLDSEDEVTLRFSTRDPDDLSHVHVHATCRLTLVSVDDLQATWSQLNHLIEYKVLRLMNGAKGKALPGSGMDNVIENNVGSCNDVFKKEMAYRLFGKLVNYSSEFQGMDAIYLSDDGLEATSKVRLNPSALTNEGFICSPFLQDSVGQISGFIPNVGLADDAFVYIANGIGSISFTPLMKDCQNVLETEYSTYCRMIPSEDGQFLTGDVWIFRLKDGALFGLFSDVKFRKLKAPIYKRIMSGHHVAPTKSMLVDDPLPNHCDNPSKEPLKASVQPMVNASSLKLDLSSERNASSRELLKHPAKFSAKEIHTTPDVSSEILHCRKDIEAVSELKSAPIVRQDSDDSLCNRLESTRPPSGTPTGTTLGSPFSYTFSDLSSSTSVDTASAKAELPPLILLPDGSGCPAVYTELRQSIGKSREVTCLSSPFFRDTGKWTGGIPQITAEYEKMITEAHPSGPISLAGWSFGGLMAYELAGRFLKEGREVSAVHLIDTPLPTNIPPLGEAALEEIHNKIDSSVTASSSKSYGNPEVWQTLGHSIKDHFDACIRFTSGYTVNAEDLSRYSPKKVTVIAAAENELFAEIMPEDPKAWASFFRPDANIEYSSLDTNHFGMVTGEAVHKLSQIIALH